LCRAPECVIVVPDGALHKLPFESLVLRSGDRPAYVLDELPPLAYAPSVAVLARLAALKPAAPDGPRSLLTVADPAYPRAAKPAGPWGPFLPLPHTAKESERVQRFFDPEQVVALRGQRATERALVAALPGRHVVHIAAHGVADDRFGNQFGALVLAPPPPGQEVPEDDGFLALHEIAALPLEGCELAVLSACVSNVGPQPPLEAGATLAAGFLAAGARRVVASHWAVDDESTAGLMAAFFQGVMTARPREPAAYARALRDARRQVRDRADGRFAAPYFWAPFVLVGPAD
jgi:CHAT domain-containing protein